MNRWKVVDGKAESGREQESRRISGKRQLRERGQIDQIGETGPRRQTGCMPVAGRPPATPLGKKRAESLSSLWLYGFLLLFGIGKYFTLDQGFFWDHTAGYAMPADYLLTHGFQAILYPSDYVAEPPLAHWYLAALWTWLGRSLLVAHLSVALFSVGVIWQVYRLCEQLQPRYAPYLFLLIVAEPALSTQLLLLSPDILLCFFALLSIRYLLAGRRIPLSLSALCLGMVSIRGFVVCAGLGLGYLLIQIFLGGKPFRRAFWYALPPFLPVLLAMASWFVYRKVETGYWLYAPDFAYLEHRKWADGLRLLKNTLGFALRLADSGRLVVWILFFAAACKMGIRSFLTFIFRSPVALLYLSILFVMLGVTLPLTNPFGDRYFLILYMLFALLTAQMLLQAYKPRAVKLACVAMILVLLSGHAWIYPEKIAKAWDSVLSHVPYYTLRGEMIRYLEEEQIAPADVAASFPLNAVFGQTDVTDDRRRFSPLDWEGSRYILYSNVYNWDDDNLRRLHSGRWKLKKEFRKGFVCLQLYVPARP